MATAQELETKLDEIFNKKAPQAPAAVKKFIFDWAPWIAIVVGILSILSAIGLWSAARGTHYSAYYYQQLCSTYQGDNGRCVVPATVSHLSFWLWLAIIFLVIQGVLYIRAYTPLREHQKAGWNLLFYAEIAYVAYAVITLFTDYDVIGHFISAAIGVAISFYLLFQIRSLYTDAVPTVSKPETPVVPIEPTPSTTIPVAPAEIITPQIIEPTEAPTETKAPAKPKPKAKKKPAKKATKKKPTTKK